MKPEEGKWQHDRKLLKPSGFLFSSLELYDREIRFLPNVFKVPSIQLNIRAFLIASIISRKVCSHMQQEFVLGEKHKDAWAAETGV